ncbi:IS110 family transposase [Anabaena azotica]|uniref:IS110 family transposase n=1 Tax=Anabaena azotica TaxID=197653 RepID=UPI001F558901|nr:transposase [Anabaena azotica]
MRLPPNQGYNQPILTEKVSSTLEEINQNAAGIDLGGGEHWVCVPADRTDKNVRRFGCFTPDLIAMADWLMECRIDTVAMEATGVYWIPVFQILEAKGFEVKLVNAHHVKTVPGRKTDVLDCQWLQKLHRLRSRLGAPKAITATAHKLARLFYQMWLTAGQYSDPGMDYYEQKYQELMLKN